MFTVLGKDQAWPFRPSRDLRPFLLRLHLRQRGEDKERRRLRGGRPNHGGGKTEEIAGREAAAARGGRDGEGVRRSTQAAHGGTQERNGGGQSGAAG